MVTIPQVLSGYEKCLDIKIGAFAEFRFFENSARFVGIYQRVVVIFTDDFVEKLAVKLRVEKMNFRAKNLAEKK